jgi:hypothetical protein
LKQERYSSQSKKLLPRQMGREERSERYIEKFRPLEADGKVVNTINEVARSEVDRLKVR